MLKVIYPNKKMEEEVDISNEVETNDPQLFLEKID
jgi:hypothetical protein